MPTKYQNNPDDEKILDEVASHLETRIKAWYGDGTKLLHSQPEVRSYPSSFFLCYTISKTDESKVNLLIKIRRHPYIETLAQTKTIEGIHDKMHLEYDALKSVYESMGGMANKNLGAIRPLEYFQPLNAIIMEEVSAVTLGELLEDFEKKITGRRKRFAAILDAAEKAGCWLRLFHHDVHEAGEIIFSSSEFMQNVERLTDKMGSSKDNLFSRHINKIFSAAAKKLENSPMYFSMGHGDMTSDNVLYKDGKVFLIDIKSERAPTYMDLGLLLTHPEIFIWQVLSFGLSMPSKYTRKYQNAIIRGYFANGIQKHTALLHLYCALQILDKWAMYERIFSTRKGVKRIIAMILNPIFKLYFLTKTNSYIKKVYSE